MTPQPKLCKDCKWFRRNWWFDYHKCGYPGDEVSLIDGHHYKKAQYCNTNRGTFDGNTVLGYCNPEGEWWTPK